MRQPAPPDSYWQRVRKFEQKLVEEFPNREFFHIISKDDFRTNTYGGKMFEVDRVTAAKNLARDTHELATDEQIKAARAEDAARRREIETTRLKEKSGTILVVTPDGRPYVPEEIRQPAKRGRPSDDAHT